MTNTLPPLSLDDIRVAGPDRDNAEAFDPRETWCLACDKLGEGYPAADVAAVLLELASAEIDAVADYWRDHTLTTLDHPALNGRDFHCPDLRLCLALQDADPEREAWTCAPTLDPGSLWETLAEVGRLRGEVATLGNLLGEVLQLHGDDNGTSTAVAIVNDWFPRVQAALAPRQ